MLCLQISPFFYISELFIMTIECIFSTVTYWLAADVVVGDVVMVMSLVVGVVQDGVMLMCLAEGVAVL